jgi:hypothetical protein
VVKVGSQGQIWAERRWDISLALAGQSVQLVRIGGRVLVYLPHRDPRTRSRQPTLHGRGALAGGLSSIPKV